MPAYSAQEGRNMYLATINWQLLKFIFCLSYYLLFIFSILLGNMLLAIPLATLIVFIQLRHSIPSFIEIYKLSEKYKYFEGRKNYVSLEEIRLLEKRNRFENRESKSLDEIFNEYYLDSNVHKSEFDRIWNNVTDILQLDAKKLLPHDKFDVELAPVKGFEIGDEIEDLEEYFLSECHKKHLDIKRDKKIDTLDDLIRLLANLKN